MNQTLPSDSAFIVFLFLVKSCRWTMSMLMQLCSDNTVKCVSVTNNCVLTIS